MNLSEEQRTHINTKTVDEMRTVNLCQVTEEEIITAFMTVALPVQT